MAARHLRRHHDRRGHLLRRPDVRRLLDRRLEGDQRVRHEPDAGSRHRLHRSVLRRDDAVAGLRRARADHRRALQPRSARHRQEGRGHGQVDGRRRHRLLRAGSRVLHLRRRASTRRSPTTPASSSTRSSCRPIPTPNTKAAISATTSAPRRATSRCRRRTPRRTCAREMLGAMARDGLRGREAPPRSGLRPARARPEVRAADGHGRPHADLQILHPPGRQHLRQDRDLHAEADLRRQRLRHALPPVDLEGRQAGVRRQQIRRPVGDLPVLHRRHHQARQGDQRLHQPDHQLLQAAGAGLRGAGAARLFGAQPLGLLPHPLHHQPEGQARRGAFPRSARQSLSRLSRRC